MTLYNRPRAEVFADNAPPSEIQPFQAWLRGLGIAFDETNGFPEMTGLNGLFNALNQYIKYLEQNGFAEWSSSLEYPVGAGVRVGSTWYRARTRNTNKPPATSQNDWAVFLNGADVASASTTVKGIVQLSNVLNSTSTSLALTAAQGKKLQDEKLDKSGGTVTGGINININADGGLNVNAGGTAQAQVRVSNSIHNGMLQASVGGNFGLYDTTFGKWIVHAKSSGDVELNGNAASATNASNVSRSIVAGNGLSGGGELNANRTVTLGTPSTITASTGNTVSTSSHTHDLNIDGFFQGTKSTNGYQRLPGGLILQWGTANSSEVTGVQSFPIPFPTNTLMVQVSETKSDTSGPTFSFAWNRGATTRSQFGWQATGNPGLFSWFAIGH